MERFDVDHVSTEVRHVILFIHQFLKKYYRMCAIQFGSAVNSKTGTHISITKLEKKHKKLNFSHLSLFRYFV